MGAWIPEGRGLSSGCSRLLRPESGVHKALGPEGAEERYERTNATQARFHPAPVRCGGP